MERTVWTLPRRYDVDDGPAEVGTGTGIGLERNPREGSLVMAMFLEELRESSSRGKAVAVRGVWGVDMALLIGRRIGFESIRCLFE